MHNANLAQKFNSIISGSKVFLLGFIFLFIGSMTFGQSVSVLVTDSWVSEIEKVDMNLAIDEFPFITAEKDIAKYMLKQKSEILESFKKKGLTFIFVETVVDNSMKYNKTIRQLATGDILKHQYKLQIKGNEELDNFNELRSKMSNLRIIDAVTSVENENEKLKQVVNELCENAKVEANTIAQTINRTVTGILDIKQVAKLTPSLVTTKKGAYFQNHSTLSLEITFETIAL